MSAHRFFLTESLDVLPEDGRTLLPLSATDLHHAVTVLRMRLGTHIVVVEPDGAAWRAHVLAADHHGVTADRFERLPPASLAHVTLVQGIAKGDRVDLVVEKATELGIEAVIPVLTERSVVRLTAEKAAARGDRWRRVAAAAAKQSQRTSVPRVSDPGELSTFIAGQLADFDVVLVAWEGAAATGTGIGPALDEADATPGSTVAVVVGPEGGLTAEEVYALESAGARAVTLGDTVLRSETAGIVASALTLYELGSLGGRPRG